MQANRTVNGWISDPEIRNGFCSDCSSVNVEAFCKTLMSAVRPQLVPYFDHFIKIKELFLLADIISMEENQLHHAVRMVELAASLTDSALELVGLKREDLINGVLFHDIGKGKEIDDRFFDSSSLRKTGVPVSLCQYPGMKWAEWISPLHDHVVRSWEIGKKYFLSEFVLEGIAMHHHVKIRPQVVEVVGDALGLNRVIRLDILNYNREQYAAPGNTLAQVIAMLDQLCAVERKFRLRLGLEPQQIEDELVRDFVIGIANVDDPRLQVIDIALTGNESVILFDLCSFGSFVKLHTEYEIQNIKKSILQLIRSLVKAERCDRNRDLVALVGGDEYAVVTKLKDERMVEDMIRRIADAVNARTGLEIRSGFGTGGTIAENFHNARMQA